MGANHATVTCGPVWARLEGPPEALQLVSEALTIDDPSARFTRAAQMHVWDGKQRFLRRPQNVFLAGLAPRVAALLEGAGCTVTTTRPSLPQRPPLAPQLRGVALRGYQEHAVAKVLAGHSSARVQSPTGSGKTVTAMEIVRQVGHPALWIVPRRALLTQTCKMIQETLGVAPGKIGEGVWQPGPVTVAIINSLATASKEALAQWSVLIADECHHAMSPMWSKVLMASPAALRVGLSGTAEPRENPVRAMRLEGLLGPVVRVAETMALAEAGFLARPRVVLLQPPRESYPLYSEVRQAVLPDWRTDPRRLSKMGGKLFDETESRGIVNNVARNAMVLSAAYRHVARGERVLVLCHTIPHSMLLARTWEHRAPLLPMWRVDGHTRSEELEGMLELYRQSAVGGLLVATPFFREGIDLPEVDALILAGGGASEIVSIQSVGRALRPRPDKQEVLIYDFWDGRRSPQAKERERDYLADHAEARLSTYQEQQFEVTR